MVSMGLFVIGFIGVMALLSTTVGTNRQARNLGRAIDFGEQLMEELRGTNATTLLAGPGGGGPTYGDITTSDGVIYRRSYTAALVPSQTTLVLVTAMVRWADEEDSTTNHTQTLSMLRTTPEAL
jgi:hypothetical protein